MSTDGWEAAWRGEGGGEEGTRGVVTVCAKRDGENVLAALLGYLVDRAQELCESRGGLPVLNSPDGLFGRKATLDLRTLDRDIPAGIVCRVKSTMSRGTKWLSSRCRHKADCDFSRRLSQSYWWMGNGSGR